MTQIIENKVIHFEMTNIHQIIIYIMQQNKERNIKVMVM